MDGCTTLFSYVRFSYWLLATALCANEWCFTARPRQVAEMKGWKESGLFVWASMSAWRPFSSTVLVSATLFLDTAFDRECQGCV